MTTEIEKCRRILDTVKRTGNHVTVTFNYRSVLRLAARHRKTSHLVLSYNPVHELVKRTLASGKIGNGQS